MKCITLEHIDKIRIVDCFNEAFVDYYVPMPKEADFWLPRFKQARVDWNHSWGTLDNGLLVAYVIHAIDDYRGKLTAYNTGTGVLPSHRGRALVDKMYYFGQQRLKESGVELLSLEVITENAAAIRVYERNGYVISHKMWCFTCTPTIPSLEEYSPKEVSYEEISPYLSDKLYSWDNGLNTIAKAKESLKFYTTENEQGKLTGCFVLKPSNGYILQLERLSGEWLSVLDAISQVALTFKINNIHESRTDLLQALDSIGAVSF